MGHEPGGRERAQLLALLSERSVGAEIGVWSGDFSARIVAALRPVRLHLIDPWLFVDAAGYEAAWYGGARAQSQADMDDLHRAVLTRFAPAIEDGTVVVHRCTSAEAADELDDSSLDRVYIDGNHRFEFVRKDLVLFAAKVKPGGLTAGDDYGAAGWWEDGVRRAVDAFISRGGCEALVLGEQFVLRKL